MNRSKWVILCVLLIYLAGGCNTLRTGPGFGSLYISGWLATYDSVRGFHSFSDNIQLFNEINPVWYNLNPNYFISGQPPILDYSTDKSALLLLAGNNGVKVLPTIQNFGVSNFDPTVIRQIINNPILRNRHVSELVNLVLSGFFDGIDIDYENLSAGDQTAYSIFIDELGQALRQHRKLLSVTVYAKTSGSNTWDGPGAQDWSSLVKFADTLKVMAYDYHWAGFHAGPIAPVDWLTGILTYAGTVPGVAGKLLVGLPSYGIDWPAGGNGTEKMYADAMNIVNQGITNSLSRSNVDHLSNPICGTYFNNVELHFTYIKNSINHTLYFQDAVALKERLAIINRYRSIVKGVTFWRLGGEDPVSWAEIQRYK
jgi:spore germination protein YaaH